VVVASWVEVAGKAAREADRIQLAAAAAAVVVAAYLSSFRDCHR
jgi:hypothetical protein